MSYDTRYLHLRGMDVCARAINPVKMCCFQCQYGSSLNGNRLRGQQFFLKYQILSRNVNSKAMENSKKTNNNKICLFKKNCQTSACESIHVRYLYMFCDISFFYFLNNTRYFLALENMAANIDVQTWTLQAHQLKRNIQHIIMVRDPV